MEFVEATESSSCSILIPAILTCISHKKKNNAKLLPFDRWLEFEYMLCKVSFYENSPTPTSQLTSGENKIELLRRVHCHISLLKL